MTRRLARFYLHIQIIPKCQCYFIVGTRWFTINLDYKYGLAPTHGGKYAAKRSWQRWPAWEPAFQWHPSGFLPERMNVR